MRPRWGARELLGYLGVVFDKEKQICFEPVVISREGIEQEVDPDLLNNPFFGPAVKLVLSRQKYLLEKIQDICQDINKPEL